jgi:esterase/lipase superfamily enzyme
VSVPSFFKALAAASFGLTISVLGAAAARADCASHVRADRVFFETDREPAGDAQIFTGERGTLGRLPLVSTGIVASPVTPENIFPCSSQYQLLRALATQFDPKRGRALMIYIHGYFTTFKQAATDALALRRQLGFNGPLLLYSWPSKATSRLAYANDESNYQWSLAHWRDLIADILQMYPGMPIDFVSHSLGSRFAADGMSLVRHFGCTQCVGPALFFAPDIDSDALYGEFARLDRCGGPPPLKPIVAAPITLYVSNKDVALSTSQRLHGHQRAGQASSEMIVCSGVDTIDVGYHKMADKAGHTYQTDERVANDARQALAGVPPTSPARKLTVAKRPAGVYYELRP